MKMKHILLFIISMFCFFTIFSQETKVKDSISTKKTYGLRLGLDLSNPIRTLFDKDRKSIELIADYRLKDNWYIASEIGFLNQKSKEDYYNYTTNGQYIKIGANYNSYKNWLSMDNEIFIGARYGFSTFLQNLHHFSIEPNNGLPIYETTGTKYNGLNAHWLELIFGIKTEIYKNLFLGFSFSAKKMISTKEPDSFKNLTVPGFDRVFLNDAGFGFNYTISYRIPLFKKEK